MTLVFSILVFACAERVEIEASGLPELGTTYEAFAAARDMSGMERKDVLDLRFEVTESLEPAAGDEPLAATYYFENEGEQRLYEIILRFRTPEAVQRHAQARGMVAAPGTKWSGTSASGMPLQSWTYQDKFMVKGALDGEHEKSILLSSPEGQKLDQAMQDLKDAADALRR